MKRYNPSEIEPKWQQKWQSQQTYAAADFSDKPKFVMLTEFPYPSGAGLHMGHLREYTLGDIIARHQRARGKNVLFPMGYDAFGLPTENYAIKHKISPQKATADNIAAFRRTLDMMGYSIDWARSFATSDPEYYRWTQWLFLRFFRAGLAYQDEIAINWCPFCKTGLANEEVVNGRHERCDNLVEKKLLKQWMLRITDYAERLIDGLADVDYPPRIADQQINWIGKSKGAEIDFEILPPRPHYVSKTNPTRADKKFTERDFVMCFVYNPKTREYLAVKWKKFPWISMVGGGVEKNEDIVTAARREILEETGYKNLKFKKILGEYTSEFFAENKDVNRFLNATVVLFELTDDERSEMGDDEKAIQEPIWLSEEEARAQIFPAVDETAQGFDWINDENPRQKLTVFTTRPDTIFGATFMVLAPEHPLVQQIVTSEQREHVETYVKAAQAKSDIERQENKQKTGVPTGAFAINPATGEKIPVWVADYVLMGYGTGAIMAVPAHDERDYEFATKFNISITQVVARDFGEAHAGEVDVQGAVIVGYNPKTNKFLGMNSENGALSVWLPGGGLEKGETFDECARRELLEETGYRPENIIQIGNIFYSHYYNSRKDSYRRSFAPHYLAIIDDKDAGDSAQEEHEKFSNVWLDFDTMRQEIAKYGSDTEHWIYILDIAKRYIENGMKSVSADEVLSGEGIVINSGKFDGLPTTEAKEKIVSWLAKKGAAREKTQYKLRDWVYSRQHYWGEPIPIIHCDKCGAVPVPDADLPVELPPVDHYEPTDDGQSPLSKIDSWVNVKCPNCGGNAKRETDTMPNWAGSNWYYLRYFDAHNSEKFADPEKLKYWGEVDLYLGGMEHTTLHLLYSRFHHQFLYDQGLVPTAEPYAARRGQGIVLAADGRKMSKSLGNVVDPVQIIDSGYGADAVRLAVTFLAPYDQTTPWSPEGVAGTYRFLTRVWNLTMNFLTKKNTANDQDLLKIQHKTIKKVSEDLEKMNFNTAIAALMEYQNALARAPEKVSRENLETLLQLLAPFAPHIANELYEKLGNDQSVDAVSWPEYDPTLIVDDEITIAVQINGKLRGEIVVPTDADEETVKTAALALENVQNHLAGKKPARVIYVPGRVVNVVVK